MCCSSGYYSWWWDDFNSTSNSHLWLHDDRGKVCNVDTKPSNGPVYNFCDSRMLDYYKQTILGSFMEPANNIAGVFFDEVDHWVMPESRGGQDFLHCELSEASKNRTKFEAVHNMF